MTAQIRPIPHEEQQVGEFTFDRENVWRDQRVNMVPEEAKNEKTAEGRWINDIT